MKDKLLLISLILTAALAVIGQPAVARPVPVPAGPATATAAYHWETILEEPGVGIEKPGERTVVADATGGLHAVYGGVRLFYARQNNGSWQHEVVDNEPAAGAGASLALDAAGRPHICYGAGQPAALRHAWRAADGWHTEAVAPSLNLDAPCSIATGPGAALAIAYRSGDDLMFAAPDAGGAWRAEPIAANAAPDRVSLLLDAQGQPQLAYSDDNLHYLYRDAGGWHSEKVMDGAYGLSLAAAGGILKLTYTRSQEVGLATRTTGGWQSETIATGESISSTSLALDARGSAHVAFYDGGGLYYAQETPEGWRTVDADSSTSYWIQHVTLALAGAAPVLAQCLNCGSLQLTQQLVTTRLEQAGPVHETIASMQGVGGSHKMAVEQDGKIHLVYNADGGLVHAYQDAAGWRREHVADAQTVDGLALDRSGRLHVAFRTATGMHYTVRDGSGWHDEVVKAPPVGIPSLALDANDQPHLAWAEPDGIRVASRSGSGWTTQFLATAGAGAPALGWDSGGRPHVVYTVGTRLRYSYLFDGAWYGAYPAPLAGAASQLALLMDLQGGAYLGFTAACYEGGYGCDLLQVAARTGREWRAEPLAECGWVCALALGVDAQRELSVAYVTTKTNPGELRYARRVAGAWQSENVAAVVADREYATAAVSLGLDAAGRPTIGFYTEGIMGLRVMRRVEGAPTPTPTMTGAATPTLTPTATRTATPTPGAPHPTQTPSLICLTPTPAAPYAGVPPATGTIQRTVAHCADDTYVRVDTGDILYDFPFVRMGARNGGTIPYVSAFLFRDVRVPRGAAITSARLRLQPELHYEGTTIQVSIAGELHGQSGDFNPNNWWPHLRPRTTARVAWSLPSSVANPVDSPDISTIIEEVVALPDWKPGNNIAILIDATDATNAWVNWHAYDGKPAAAGQLSLTYQPK